MPQFVTDRALPGMGYPARALPTAVVLPHPDPLNPSVELFNDGPCAVSVIFAQVTSGVIGNKLAMALEPGVTVLSESGLSHAWLATVQAHGDRAMFCFRRGRMVGDEAPLIAA